MTYAVDFKSIREKVSIEQVASWLGFELKRTGDTLRGCCPVHQGSNPRQFVVTPAKGLWHCFAPECGKGGDVIQLLADARGMRQKEAAQFIAEHFLNGKARPEKKDLRSIDYLQAEHPLLQALGLSKETCAAFGAGYKPKGLFAGRLAIPLHDGGGNLVGYTGRALKKEQQPMLLFPKDVDPRMLVFNAHRVENGVELHVTDDPLKVLLAHEHGITNAVAFLAEVGPPQLGMLTALMEQYAIPAMRFF